MAVHVQPQNTDPRIVQREFESDERKLGALRGNIGVDMDELQQEGAGPPVETRQRDGVSIVRMRKNDEGRMEGHSETTPDPPGPLFPRPDLQNGGWMARDDFVHFACTGTDHNVPRLG